MALKRKGSGRDDDRDSKIAHDEPPELLMDMIADLFLGEGEGFSSSVQRQ